MGKLITISIIGSAALAACFGSGPEPQKSQATALLVAPSVPSGGDPCNDSRYISSIAFNDTNGYALFEPYTPMNSGNCTMNNTSASVGVVSFDFNGGNTAGNPVGPAGQSNQSVSPPIAASPGTAYWATGNLIYANAAMGNLDFGGGSGNQGNFTPISLAPGPSKLFILGYMSTGGFQQEPWSPQWPQGGGGGLNLNQGTLISVPLPFPQSPITATTVASLTPYCAEVKHCLASNPTTVYYLEQSMNAATIAAITSVSKIDGTTAPVNTISNTVSQSAIPVGIAASPLYVAWAVANSGMNLTNQQLQPGCWIYAQSVAAPPNGDALRFQSGKFSCLDVALDASYAYFAIVASDEPSSNCNGGCAPPIKGIGIGRVSLSGPMTFESLSTRVSGDFGGPRRLFVSADGGSLFVVDPTVVAKIPLAAFDGQQDIAP